MRREKIQFVSSLSSNCTLLLLPGQRPSVEHSSASTSPSHTSLRFHSTISIHNHQFNPPSPPSRCLYISPSCSAACRRPYLLHQCAGVDDQHSVLGAAPQLAAHRHHLGDGAAGRPQPQRLGGLGIPEASWRRRVKKLIADWQMAMAILTMSEKK